MNSADAARAADVPPSTLRYYERRGFLTPARDPHSGYRRYTEADVRRVRFVRRAGELGFGMGDVAAFLALARGGAVPGARLRAVVDAKLDDLDARIADLTRMRTALAAVADAGEVGACACPVEAALVGGAAEDPVVR
ncbi:MerR family transcriptional regulator [Streptomyces sp. B-S-A8]|uniref:MerR family transcriptional regulator n=1 Tax=Streptomyces solicavernae TaxID=3043614 RepID=A0ABT6RU43_9ACTN|nr:MerR family transcriptional regulator [Streptomyces sp. B-S-A8]MDI3387714.1 MerR family transcriptional regulator [Streptomyces sp. B-S-A8]